MKKLFLAAALAFAPAAAFAQTDAPAPAAPAAATAAPLPDADPALWVVRDEDTTIYLFGTFHLLDGRREWFNDEIRAAFDASEELVLEAVLPEDAATMQPLVFRYAVDPERTLSERLGEERNRALGEALAGLGLPAAAFDRFEPWFAAMTLEGLASQRLGIRAEHGAEMVLLRAARERGIAIGELEGVEYQLDLFDRLPEATQLAWLNLAVDNIAVIVDGLPPMLAAWSEGDVERLAELLNGEIGEYPEFYRILLSERNAAWAEWVDDRLDRPGTLFVAVGAGHLGGRDSLQAMLAARGIPATRLD
jgi:hypothetical protein